MEMVVKRFTFSAAHRLMNHDGDCRFLHGHNWVVEVGVEQATAAKLKEKTASGMIMDFGRLNGEVGTWLEIFFDHTLLLNAEDKEFIASLPSDFCKNGGPFLMPGDPTVEIIGALLRTVLIKILEGFEVNLCFLKIHETESSFYEWRNE